jgi:Na+-driven multidrug efflux pump
MEKARFCAIVSSVSLLLNIILNALIIFVLFPGDIEKSVTGVAFTTIIARIFELACCVLHSLRGKNIQFSLPVRDNVQKQLLWDYLRYTSPVLANFIVYGGALAASVAIIGHVSSDMVAANAITNVVRNMAIVLCGGIGAG